MNNNNMNEVDKFFDALPTEDKKIVDIFDTEVKPAEQAKVELTDEDEPRKNRRHRRLEEALEKERLSNIALAERVKVLSEFREDNKPSKSSDELDPRLLSVFENTDAGREGARKLADYMADERARAKKEAFDEIERSNQEQQELLKQSESIIDSNLESIEDKFDVDLTSNAPKAVKMRREFLTTVQKLSPKDAEGNVVEYADFESTFEVFQQTQKEEKVDNSRQKEIAARSMQKPSSQEGTKPTVTPGFRGWQKDYNINQ